MHTQNAEGTTASQTHADAVKRAEAKVRELADQLEWAKADLRSLRGEVAAAKRAPRECGCGCGSLTSGGTFVPGHDAKLRSRLLGRIREDAPEGDGAAALAELSAYPKLLHETGEHEIGRARREREAKEARAAERTAEATRAKATKEAERKQADTLKAKSREEQAKEADERIAAKDAALAKAKAGPTVVAGKN